MAVTSLKHTFRLTTAVASLLTYNHNLWLAIQSLTNSPFSLLPSANHLSLQAIKKSYWNTPVEYVCVCVYGYQISGHFACRKQKHSDINRTASTLSHKRRASKHVMGCTNPQWTENCHSNLSPSVTKPGFWRGGEGPSFVWVGSHMRPRCTRRQFTRNGVVSVGHLLWIVGAAIFIRKPATLLYIEERGDFWDQMWPRIATKSHFAGVKEKDRG